MAFLLVWTAGAPIDSVRSFGLKRRGLSSMGCKTQPRLLRLAGAFSIAKGSATSRLYWHGKSTEGYSGAVIPWENQYGIDATRKAFPCSD